MMLFEEIDAPPLASLWGAEAYGGPSYASYSTTTRPYGLNSQAVKRPPSVAFTLPRSPRAVSLRLGPSKRCRHPLPSPVPLPVPVALPSELHSTIAAFLDVHSALAVSASCPSLTLVYSTSLGAVRLCVPPCEPYAPPPLSRLSGVTHLFIDGPIPLLRMPTLTRGQGPVGLVHLELRGLGLLGARGGARAGEEGQALVALVHPMPRLAHLLLHLGDSGAGVSPLVQRLIRAIPSLKSLHTTTHPPPPCPPPPLPPCDSDEAASSPRALPSSISVPPSPLSLLPPAPCYGGWEGCGEGPGLEELSLCLHSSLTPLLLPPPLSPSPSSPSLLSLLLPRSLRRVGVCGPYGGEFEDERGEGNDSSTDVTITHHLLASLPRHPHSLSTATMGGGLLELELRGLAWDGSALEVLGSWLLGSSVQSRLQVLRLADGALLGDEGEGQGNTHWAQGTWEALRVLELSNNMLGFKAGSGARAVGSALAMGRLPSLTCLDLSWNDDDEDCVLHELCMGAGKALRRLGRAEGQGQAGRLAVGGCGVSVRGMQALTQCLAPAEGEGEGPLRLRLEVGHNPLLGEGGWGLPEGLVALDMAHCRLHDAQLPTLLHTTTHTGAPHVLRQVQELRLCGNEGLSDQGLCEALLGPLGEWGRELRHLGLEGTGAGPQCARALRRALQAGQCEELVQVEYVRDGEGQWDDQMVDSILLHRALGRQPPTALTTATEEWVTWLDMD